MGACQVNVGRAPLFFQYYYEKLTQYIYIMKKIFAIVLLLVAITAKATDFTDVSVTVSGMTTTFDNGKLLIKIDSNGRVSSIKFNKNHELLASNGVYFDYTTANGNQGLSPSKVEVIKNTAEMCEVLYSATSGNTIFQQGYIVRKNVAGIYTYVIATGTSTSASEPIKEARVCTRLVSDMLNGYVDYRMNGKIPSNSEMTEAEKTENTVQDATYYLSDGSIYTKYNWANYVERDTVHGLSNGYYGLWNIPVSYEWLNGGPERQELMVHATSKSPITIQMLQGEHFGGQAMVLNDGEKKLYGPFLIYTNYNSPTITGPILNAQRRALTERDDWPYQWFDNDLYPKERGTVSGHLSVTTGQRNDKVRVILAQEKGVDPMRQVHGYQFWTTTDENGDFVIKNVRPGNYFLYAYAQAGDVTDMLEVDDITVTEGEQSLGTINWTPVKYSNLLWMIGENNRRSDEFCMSDTVRQYGLWKLVPQNLTYTIGTSDPKKDWYYAQCQKDGTWTIKFNLDQTYAGTAALTASLAGCTGTGTTVTVAVNGTTRATWKPGINDAGIYRSAVNSGFHHLQTCTFPASSLKNGSNTITLKMTGNGSNGGFMYDCLKLEAGDIVTAVNGVIADETAKNSPKIKKIIKGNQLLIGTANGIFTAVGAQVK